MKCAPGYIIHASDFLCDILQCSNISPDSCNSNIYNNKEKACSKRLITKNTALRGWRQKV